MTRTRNSNFMSLARRRRAPRVRQARPPEGDLDRARWKGKLDPQFVKDARQYVLVFTGKAGTEEADGYLRGWLKSMLAESGSEVTEPTAGPRIAMTMGQFQEMWAFWWTCFMKYWEFPTELVQKVQQGGPAGLKALDKLNSVLRMMYERLHSKPDAKKALRFKTDSLHTTLMLTGLGSENGLRSLTEEELADFFDYTCNCGKEHSSEALRRLRYRVDKKLKQLGAQDGEHRSSVSAPPPRESV
jgi:hypothetical protein